MKTKFYLFLSWILFPGIMNAQWISQSTAFTTPGRGLWDIAVPDANTVWALAYTKNLGQIIPVMELTRTTNGGNSFTAFNFPFNCYWINITAVDSLTAWVAAVNPVTYLDGAIYKTTDGGISWNELGANTIFNSTSFVDFVYFFNSNDGVAMGDPNSSEFEIYTTNDGGTSWTPVAGSFIPDPLSGEYGNIHNYYVLGNHIWFGTNKARIFHSVDKGLTWTVSSTGISMPGAFDYIDFCYWSPDNGIARKYEQVMGQNIEVKTTNDGGTTWNSVTVSGDFFGSVLGGIAYVPGTASTLISTRVNTPDVGSSYSNDGGLTWTTIDYVGHYITKFINNTTGWSGGESIDSTHGGIYKYSGVPLGIYNADSGKEIYFNAYPNPSAGNVLLQMANAGNQNVLVSVCDFTGRKVFETLFEKPGEFFLQNIDLTSLTAGVYLMKLSLGENSITRKIIIE